MDQPTYRRLPAHPGLPAQVRATADADGMVLVGSPAYVAAYEAWRRERAMARVGKPALPSPAKPAAAKAIPPTPVTLSPRKLATGAAGIARAIVRPNAVPLEILNQRLATCESCPHLKPLKPKVAGVPLGVEYMGCGKCGCAYKAKVRNAGESCPIGRWGPVPKS